MYKRQVSTGTGIVLTADGYIVTNAHIIAGAEQVNVTLSDDSLWSAQLVGFEPLEDLAVLKIDASGLTPAQFGDDTLLRSGDPVSAIGNPMGYRSTITPGIVSALDQPVSVEGTTMYLLQTSAAINYGSSGGALLNDRGQVVGVTTIKTVSYTHLDVYKRQAVTGAPRETAKKGSEVPDFDSLLNQRFNRQILEPQRRILRGNPPPYYNTPI